MRTGHWAIRSVARLSVPSPLPITVHLTTTNGRWVCNSRMPSTARVQPRCSARPDRRSIRRSRNVTSPGDFGAVALRLGPIARGGASRGVGAGVSRLRSSVAFGSQIGGRSASSLPPACSFAAAPSQRTRGITAAESRAVTECGGDGAMTMEGSSRKTAVPVTLRIDLWPDVRSRYVGNPVWDRGTRTDVCVPSFVFRPELSSEPACSARVVPTTAASPKRRRSPRSRERRRHSRGTRP